MLIDAHCHLFGKDMVDQQLLKLHKSFSGNSVESIAKWFSNKDAENVMLFLSHGMDFDSFELYEHMEKSYNQEFIAVPLMLDLTYTMENAFLKSDNESFEKFLGFSKNLNLSIKEKIKSSSLFKTDIFSKTLDKWQNKLDNSQINIFKDNYNSQIKDLTELKAKMPDKVYPFFSIDPRRDDEFADGILGEIKRYVGKDKPFQGLKLYTSLGYSPTNPVLYNYSKGKSVYSWCQDNKIPITVHSGYEGFSHLLHRNLVDGDVYYPKSGEVIPMQDLCDDKIFKYESSISQSQDMVKERQLMLNHPKLWRKVLEKYPKLKIDFAHLGGNEQISLYAQGNETGFWTKQLIELLEDYPNTYTDLSFFRSFQDEVFSTEKFYKQVYKQLPRKVKNKIMFGSDFFMLDLVETELNKYLNDFEEAFGWDFHKISVKNPSQYLGIKV